MLARSWSSVKSPSMTQSRPPSPIKANDRAIIADRRRLDSPGGPSNRLKLPSSELIR